MNRKITGLMMGNPNWFLHGDTERLFAVSISFSMLLVAARICYTGRLTFVFLVWNLILAVVPCLISGMLTRKPQWIGKKIIFIPLAFTWLAFIPNSFYLLTDLFHLRDRHHDLRIPDWYDLVMIFSFAWNGLFLGVLSVRQMEKIMGSFYITRNSILFIYPVMWLNALGVYVGRYLRYNSWDMITNPLELAHDIGVTLFHPFIYRNASGMIICFSVLMTIVYVSLGRLSKTF